MNDTDNGAAAERLIERFYRDRWTRLVCYVKRKVSQRKAKKENQPPVDKAARITASATSWIAVFTLVSVLVNVEMFFVLRRQLKEMHDSGTDTHILAQAANTEAGKMSDVSTAADKIRQAAQDMVTQDRRIAENAQKALEANSRQSKAALDATVQNIQKDERAWIGLGDFNVLKFNGSDPFQLAVPFINSGKSPAIKTEIATNYSITDSFPTGPDEKAGYTFEKANAIPPQGRYVLMIINRAVPPQYDAIVNGKSFLRFDGKYRYQDVYKPDVIHTTNFCLYYNSQLKIMTYCFTGNDMD